MNGLGVAITATTQLVVAAGVCARAGCPGRAMSPRLLSAWN